MSDKTVIIILGFLFLITLILFITVTIIEIFRQRRMKKFLKKYKIQSEDNLKKVMDRIVREDKC